MRLPFDPAQKVFALTPTQAAMKRGLDLALAVLLLPLLLPAILCLIVLARRSTGQPGLFCQQRVGLYGHPFTLYKIRSMRPLDSVTTHVTTSNDPRITAFGRIVRRWKLDEFPQIINVLRGDMSFVGPRPDVAEAYALAGDEARPVLCIRPGITGPASLAFRHEEQLLADAQDPEAYNRDVIFPAKIKANLAYIREWSLAGDLAILIRTLTG